MRSETTEPLQEAPNCENATSRLLIPTYSFTSEQLKTAADKLNNCKACRSDQAAFIRPPNTIFANHWGGDIAPLPPVSMGLTGLDFVKYIALLTDNRTDAQVLLRCVEQ